jgi:hypothetical protein
MHNIRKQSPKIISPDSSFTEQLHLRFQATGRRSDKPTLKIFSEELARVAMTGTKEKRGAI